MRLPSISLVYSLFSCYLRRMTCDDLLRCYYARPTCDVVRIFVYKQIKGLSDSSIFLSAILVFILKFFRYDYDYDDYRDNILNCNYAGLDIWDMLFSYHHMPRWYISGTSE